MFLRRSKFIFFLMFIISVLMPSVFGSYTQSSTLKRSLEEADLDKDPRLMAKKARIELLIEQAYQGNSEAQYKLADVYWKGKYVKQNMEKVIELYTKAAD